MIGYPRTINPKRPDLLDLARRNARNARRQKEALVDLRESRGITQEQVADRAGWSHEKVRKFESYSSNPKAQDFTMYALCVGASITTTITKDPAWENR